MSCPCVFCGRIAIKPKGNREIAYLPYGIRASYRWSLPLIRTLSQIYVLVIKPHCNDICAAFWAFGFYTAIPTLNPVFSERLREPLSMPENNVMRNYNNAWSRHFHLPQSPLVDLSRTQIPIWVRGLEIPFPESCIEMEFLHSVTKWEFGNETKPTALNFGYTSTNRKVVYA